jgi:predicted aspartyl protease
MSPARICEAFDPNCGQEHPPLKEFNCIWDTGATNTVISQKVVTECGLQPIGMTRVKGVNSESTKYTYLVNVILPNGVGLAHLKVIESDIGGSDVLIGMDVISKGDFVVTNYKGKTVFSFRTPSIECIDFVAHLNTIKNQPPPPPNPVPFDPNKPISRRGPCPCGSGNQYRKCCEQKK